MRVLVLTTNTRQMAATRYRVLQYEPAARDEGIHLEVRPFLDEELEHRLYLPGSLRSKLLGLLRAAAGRLGDLLRLADYDLVYVLREAALFGPPLAEVLAAAAKPVVYDLDDAVWLPYRSPTYGWLAVLLKMPWKTHLLTRIATAVVAGNDYLACHAARHCPNVTVIPSVVDTEHFAPAPRAPRDLPMIGWVGSHSTTRYLTWILPALREAAARHPFKLLVVGGRPLDLSGLDAIQLPWSLEREVEYFQSLDIGLYPMTLDRWALGKSALKAVQYGAVGVPTVASPTGAVRAVVEHGRTGLLAWSLKQWTDHLLTLLRDQDLRKELGRRARERIVEHFSVARYAPVWIQVLKRAAARSHHW